MNINLQSLNKKMNKKLDEPLQILDDFISSKKITIKKNKYSRSVPLAAHYDSEKVTFLEPILSTLLDLKRRIETLEGKANEANFEVEVTPLKRKIDQVVNEVSENSINNI